MYASGSFSFKIKKELGARKVPQRVSRVCGPSKGMERVNLPRRERNEIRNATNRVMMGVQ